MAFAIKYVAKAELSECGVDHIPLCDIKWLTLLMSGVYPVSTDVGPQTAGNILRVHDFFPAGEDLGFLNGLDCYVNWVFKLLMLSLEEIKEGQKQCLSVQVS